jgi:hypothetical protein
LKAAAAGPVFSELPPRLQALIAARTSERIGASSSPVCTMGYSVANLVAHKP